MDGEHKLRELIKTHLLWFIIIIDIYHVIEYLWKVITYLEKGKELMHYDIYIAKGYPIGSGVVEGACKNLVKDKMEQCGMRWTIDGAETTLSMRSIQINKMTNEYWRYHIAQERQKLYGWLSEENIEELAA